MEDLQTIEGICAQPDPLPGLGFIAQVRPVDPKSDQAQRLDEQLDTAIGGPDLSRIALAVPGECRDRFEFAECFKVTLAGNSEMYDELDADQLIEAVRHKPDGDRLAALRAGRVEMFADTEGAERLSRKVPADQWLTAEVSEGIVHYFYWQGQWYEIGAEYLATVESRIAELLARPATVTLPTWTKSDGSEKHDEDWYNKEIAKHDGYVLLDKTQCAQGACAAAD
jgi:uncharacterized protein (TIGR04141 family)